MKKIKRLFLYVALSALLVCCALFFGACDGLGFSGFGGFGGFGGDDEVEHRDANIRYDGEAFRFDVDGSGYYTLTLETGDTSVLVADDYYNNHETDPFYANVKYDLQENNALLGNGFNVVARKYTVADDRLVWEDSVYYQYLPIPQYRLDKQNGVMVWDAVEGAEKYAVIVNEEEFETTATQTTLPEVLSTKTASFCIRALGADGEQWLSVWGDTLYVQRTPTVRDLGYEHNYISFRTLADNQTFGYANDNFVYHVTINDGGEITQRRNIPHQWLAISLPYVPKSDNLQISVTVGLQETHSDYARIYDSTPSTIYPTCLGAVDEFAYDESTWTLSWGQEEGEYRVTLGDEVVEFQKPSVNVWDLYDGKGLVEVTVERLTWDEGYYYLPRTGKLYYAEQATITPTLKASEDVVDVAITGVDQAVAYIEMSYYDVSEEKQGVENPAVSGGQATYEIVLPEAEDYWYTVQCEQFFDMDAIVIHRKSYGHISKLEKPSIQKVKYQTDGSAWVTYDASGRFEVKYNGETTTSTKNYFAVPKDFTSAETITFSFRNVMVGTKTCYVPSAWTDITVHKLPTINNFRVENGVMRWDCDRHDKVQTYNVYNVGDLTEREWQVELPYTRSFKVTPKAVTTYENGEVWLDGDASEWLTLRLLGTPTVTGFTDTGLTFSAVDGAQSYALEIEMGSVMSLPTRIVQTDTTFDLSEYLKAEADGNITVHVQAIGDKSQYFDGDTCAVRATRNASLTFTLSNADKKLSWVADREYPAYDYRVYDSAQAVRYSQDGNTDKETEMISFSHSDAGAYVLSVTPYAMYDESNKLYYLKTGDETLDAVTQTFYQAKYDMMLENGYLCVTTVPALPNRIGANYKYEARAYEAGTDNYICTVIATTTQHTWNVMSALHTATCDRVVYREFSVDAKWAEYDSVFAFEPKWDRLGHIVKRTEVPTPTISFENQIAGKRYYEKINGDIRHVTDKYVPGTVQAVASVLDCPYFTYTFYVTNGSETTQHKLSTNRLTLTCDDFTSVSVKVFANRCISLDEFVVVSDTQSEEYTFERYEPNVSNTEIHTMTSFYISIYHADGNGVFTPYRNGEVCGTVECDEIDNREYMLKLNEGVVLQDGDVIVWEGYVEASDTKARSDDIYITFVY